MFMIQQMVVVGKEEVRRTKTELGVDEAMMDDKRKEGLQTR